jgi:hypothetical protein
MLTSPNLYQPLFPRGKRGQSTNPELKALAKAYSISLAKALSTSIERLC